MKRAVLVAIPIICGLIGFFLISHSKDKLILERNLKETVDNNRKYENSTEATADSEVAKKASERSGQVIEKKESLPDLKKELLNDFKNKEASRAKVLLETRLGQATMYVLGVEPPSLKEIESSRNNIATLQKRVNQKDSQALDSWIQRNVKNFDPFGVDGKKIVKIYVNDDEKLGMTATSYPVKDFTEEVERIKNPPHLDEKNTGRVSMSFAGDNGIADRYSALIQR